MRLNPEFLRRGYLKKQTQFLKGQNDVKSIFTMVYGVLVGRGSEKTKPIQSQTKPNAGLRPEIRSTKLETRNKLNGCYLKKQSQFVPAQMSAKSCTKEDYDNNAAGRVEKNKAKQSQFLYRKSLSSIIMT